MANIKIDIKNRCGTVTKDELTDIGNGTKWEIKENKLIIGSEVIEAIPCSDSWKFVGNWGQKTTEGVVTKDMVFVADFENDAPVVGKVYEFLSYKNYLYLMDVYGASLEEKARVVLYGKNDTVAQKFAIFASEVEGHSDWKMIVNQNNWRCFWADSSSGQLQNQPIVLHIPPVISGEHDWSVDWFFNKESKKITINGTEYNAFNIAWLKNSNYRIDNAGNQITELNSIVLYETNGTDAQSWIPMQTVFTMVDWPLAKISLSGPDYGGLNQSVIRTLSLSNGNEFQMRYRTRRLKHNTNIWTEFSSYTTINYLTSDWGWGDASKKNIEPVSNFEMIGPISGQFDATEYEIDVRVIGVGFANYPAASCINTISTIMKQKPKVTVGPNCTITTNGLALIFNSDVYRTMLDATVMLQKLTLSDGTTLAENVTCDIKMKKEFTIFIPLEKLIKYPSEGDVLSADCLIDYNDAYIKNNSLKIESVIQYSGGYITPKITFSYINKYDAEIKVINALSTTELRLVYEHDGDMIVRAIPKVSNALFHVPAPLNIDYDIYVFMSSGSQWGSKSFDIKKRTPSSTIGWSETKSIVINGAKKELVLEIYKDQPFEKSTNLGMQNLVLEGKKYDDVFYTSAKNSDISINGLVVNHDQRLDLESIMREGYCLVRDTKGGLYNCAIKSVNFKKISSENDIVDISLVEVNHEVDIVLPY